MSYSHSIKRLVVIASVLSCTQILSACATAHDTAYTPGLGELMTQISARHLKLWYAGSSENWELADYELEEMHETLEDLAKYHPTHKKIAGSVPAIIASFMTPFITQMEVAVKNQDKGAFQSSYDNLTTACNSCHKANNYGFNILERPRANPFANQSFRGKL
ncbi:conserved exported hypothetical protein [Crenothrix polyspora]|uniref:Cytochrome c domain-containing protein n=1 Tax=Crenothrix polyspora TaxID=360316 RepID=A0A1R4HII5_9GAMM|nr:hypothetical protein [Crenothrix polyspora]SJM96037.1 conserved exported hypothetical protein [Crenothrix polyspora]